jgi:hypothetical protein
LWAWNFCACTLKIWSWAIRLTQHLFAATIIFSTIAQVQAGYPTRHILQALFQCITIIILT